MPSFVPPQVDHNLYKPILPQDNVMQVFSLLDQKQQMYNQGVKQAQYKVSSMLNLENEVTSEPVKGMVTDFNKKANELVKKYSNLDFSLQENVSLVDNIYDPLLSDKLFLQDYSATKQFNSEMKRALNYRDSDKKDIRDLYSETNVQALNIKRLNLAEAKDEKSVMLAARDLYNSHYTPYTDYKKTIREHVAQHKDFYTVSMDQASGGYIITNKNGALAFPSYQAYLESFLTANELEQMKIEQQVGFYGSYKNSGLSKEDFLSDNFNMVLNSYQQGVKRVTSTLQEYNKIINSYPEYSKLNATQKKEVDQLKEKVLQGEVELKNRTGQLEDFNSYMERASNGEVALPSLYALAEDMYVKAGVDANINDMARALANMNMSRTLKSDDAYWKRIEEGRLSRQLNETIRHNQVTEYQAAQDAMYGLYKEGLDIDPKTGKVIPLAGGALDPNSVSYVPDTAPSSTQTTGAFEVEGYNGAVEQEVANFQNEQLNFTSQLVGEFLVKSGLNLNTQETNEVKGLVDFFIKNPSAQFHEYKGSVSSGSLAAFEKLGVTAPGVGITSARMGQNNFPSKPNFSQAGGASNTTSLIKNVVAQMEDWVSNTAPHQVAPAQKSAYDNATRLVNGYKAAAMEHKVAMASGADAVQNTINLFEQKYPMFKGYMKIDPRTGKITYPTGRISFDGATMQDASDITKAFDGFLKTKEGAAAYASNFLVKVINSDEGSFNWYKENKTRITPENYTLTMDEFDNSRWDPDTRKTKAFDSTQMGIYNTIVQRFMTAIPDAGWNLANKNRTVFAKQVFTGNFEDRIIPDANFLNHLLGVTTQNGEPINSSDGLGANLGLDPEQVAPVVQKILQHGFLIKKQASPVVKRESIGTAKTQAYLDAGNSLNFNASTGGHTAKFSTTKSSYTGDYLFEGSMDNPNDFLLSPELPYSIVNNNGNFSIIPAGSSSQYKFFSTPVPAVSLSSFKTIATESVHTQAAFNSAKESPELLQEVLRLAQERGMPMERISGSIIIEALGNISKK